MTIATLLPLIGRLIVVIDAPGNIPLFLAALRSVSEPRGRVIILREMLIALGLMALFAVFGASALTLLGIDLKTIGISGGIILFLIALRMLFPKQHGPMIAAQSGEPFIFPLAVPLVAGPSALAVLIDLHGKETPALLAAGLFGAWLISTAILLASSPLKRLLGTSGLAACERVMGLILLLISVQMFLDGMSLYFPSAL